MTGPDTAAAALFAAAAALAGVGGLAGRGARRSARREHARDQARLRAYQARVLADAAGEADTEPVAAVPAGPATIPLAAPAPAPAPVHRTPPPTTPGVWYQTVPRAGTSTWPCGSAELGCAEEAVALIRAAVTAGLPGNVAVLQATARLRGVTVEISDLPMAATAWGVVDARGGEYCTRERRRKEITSWPGSSAN